VVVAEEMEEPVYQRCSPFVRDDLGAQDDIAERARHALR
jgi:hypothetical protein